MQNQAENDFAYSDLACSGKNLPYFATTPYSGYEASCKPCCGAPGNLLQYPRHEEFNRRISAHQFSIIRDDLQRELYNRSGYVTCLGNFCLGSTGADRGRAVTFESLHNVLSYYNRVLFHPMLIDAQVFAPRQGKFGVSAPSIFEQLQHCMTSCHSTSVLAGRRDYFVGFLVASSSDEYLSFKRPVMGKSRGYLNPSVTRNINIRLETGYSVPETVPSAAPTPPSMHSSEVRAYTPPAGAHMVRVPETVDATSGPACPPELSGRPVPIPVYGGGYGGGYGAPAGAYGTPYQQISRPVGVPAYSANPQQQAPAPSAPVVATVVYPAVQAPSPQVMVHHQEASAAQGSEAVLVTAQPV